MTNQPKYIVTAKNRYIGTSESVEGQRNIPAYGNKLYIDKMITKNGALNQAKFPSQYSETLIKNRIRVYGNPLNELSPSNIKIYSLDKYYSMNRPSTISKLLSSKRGSLAPPQLEKPKSNYIQVAKPTRIYPSVQSSLSNINTPSNVRVSTRLMSFNTNNLDNAPVSSITPSYRSINNNINSPITNMKRDNNFDYNVKSNFRIDSAIKSASATRSSTKQNLKQNLEMRQELRQDVRNDIKYKMNFKTSAPVRPIPIPIALPKLYRFPNFKAKSFKVKLPKFNLRLSTKKSKERLDILPSLRNVIVYEGLTGKEAKKPKKTRRVKRDFETQLYGQDVFGSPIPVYQKQKY